MSSRLRRIVRKVNNNELQKRRAALPPVRQLLREAKILRERFPHGRKVIAVCDAFEETTAEMIADGYVLRSGGGEATKPRPMPPEWKDSPEDTATKWMAAAGPPIDRTDGGCARSHRGVPAHGLRRGSQVRVLRG